jgi:putative ABC transport system ATP-binding protein
MAHDTPAVQAIDLSRVHHGGGHTVRSVDHVSLTVHRGEVVAVIGPSGSGKSTLLSLLGGLDQADEGQVWVAGIQLNTLRGDGRARFRRRTCGFVVQGTALLPQATAAENVEVPLVLDGIEASGRHQRAIEALERVGLAEDVLKLTDQLSGGEQQRVAIARALVHEPDVVLADEPTGSLDSENAQEIARLLVGTARDRGAALILVTHDRSVAAHADRTLEMHSGRIGPRTPPEPKGGRER